MSATGAEAKSRPRVVAIVQARMGSTRLPGKVMRDLAGKPLLWHVVHRLKDCKTVDHIAIATSTNAHDDPIVEFGHEHGVAVARGSEHNVLARYMLAAWQTGAEIIVRVSSDAPFLDPEFIDHLVESLIDQDGDYVTLEPDAKCAHEGVDPFSRRALDKLAREAAHHPVAREHVTGYFKHDPDFVRVVHAPAFERLASEPARLTVDTPDDLAFAEAVHARLEAKAGEASLTDLLWLIEREPHLKQINAHVRQKPIDREPVLALLRCDGGAQSGYGHVRRTVSLARALRDREGCGILIALAGDENAARPLRDAGFETVMLPPADAGKALTNLVHKRTPDMVVSDCRDGLSRDDLGAIAGHAPVLAVIDDSHERRLAATHAYYPPVAGAQALAWQGAQTQVRIGWEWAVLGFNPAFHQRTSEGVPMRIVVSMGGSDPFGYTRLAAQALAMIREKIEARFLIGPGFAAPEELAREIEALSPNFSCLRNADTAAEFANADLGLIAFGVTAYELAALGVPALYVGLYDDHLESARAFERASLGIMLGLGKDLHEDAIARAVWTRIRDAEWLRVVREAGPAVIDGKGAERIAADLVAAVEAKRAATPVRAAS